MTAAARRSWREREPGSPALPFRRPKSPPFFRHSHIGKVALDLVEPEVQLKFENRKGEPANADLALTARDEEGELVLTVEGKADEEFGQTISGQFSNAPERLAEVPNSGRIFRLIELVRSILPAGVPGTVKASRLRYQLLTALAATLVHIPANVITEIGPS